MSRIAYRYQQLQHPDDIRLVFLLGKCSTQSSIDDCGSDQSTDSENDLSIAIRVAKLGQCPYSALSYAWGENVFSEDLLVHDQGSIKSLKITPSLQAALRHLQGTETKVLWIDQLCINQKDKEEKSREVWRMSSIYATATDVTIWLGESYRKSDLAMIFIPQISVQNIDNLATRGDLKDSWSALADLMRRRWFSRRWIIQEVAFAKRAYIQCGHHIVRWSDFAEVVTLFENRIDAINPLFREEKLEWVDKKVLRRRKLMSYALIAAVVVGAVAARSAVPSISSGALSSAMYPARDFEREMRSPTETNTYEYPIGQVRGVGAHSLVAALGQIVRKLPGQSEPERLCTMESLLSYLPTFNCGDDKDIIFAIASLARGNAQMQLSYMDPPALTCIKVMKSTVAETGSLNIICRPWAPALPGSPSWLPSISNLPFEYGPDGIYVRNRADCLVSHPGRCPYKASGSRLATVEFICYHPNYFLLARGFRLLAEYQLLDPVANGKIPVSWVQTGGYRLMGDDSASEEEKERFWRTLVCDRDYQGGPAPHWMRRACEELYKDIQDAPMDTRNLLQTRPDEPGSPSGLMKEFLNRVQAATWGRRMIRQGKRTLGLLPGDAEARDQICVLFGCDVPVLMRQRSDGIWEFVGEVYLHGFMNGEALDRSFEEEDFYMK